MTGLSNDNPFRGHQLIQDTIGEEQEDQGDEGFYADPENIQEMPLYPATDDRILNQALSYAAGDKNLETLYSGEDVSPPKFEDRQQQMLEGGESEAEDGEEEDGYQQQNFVEHELAFTPDATMDDNYATRDMGSSIAPQREPLRQSEGRHPLDIEEEEGEEEAIAQ